MLTRPWALRVNHQRSLTLGLRLCGGIPVVVSSLRMQCSASRIFLKLVSPKAVSPRYAIYYVLSPERFEHIQNNLAVRDLCECR